MAERIKSSKQWSEATKFLMQLADDEIDGMDDSAELTPLRIQRDEVGGITGVVALVDENEAEVLFTREGSFNLPMYAESTAGLAFFAGAPVINQQFGFGLASQQLGLIRTTGLWTTDDEFSVELEVA